MNKFTNITIRLVIAAIYLIGGWTYFKMNLNDHVKLEKLKETGIVASAVVTDFQQKYSGLRPFVEVETPENHKISFTALSGHSVKVGDVLPAKINPENYLEAALVADIENYPSSFKDSVFGSAVFCSICFLVAMFTLFSKRFTLRFR